MKPIVVLDSSPLGLIVQQRDYDGAERCREWLKRLVAMGVRIIVPEIVNYELRRELLRMRKTVAIDALATFNAAIPNRFLPITSAALDLAAELWAQTRQRGKPTADPHALDIDVILSAQLLATGLDPAEFVVATTNVSHISQFVPAAPWETI
jgi:predicted nucleic acid-binding protein